MKTKLSDRIRTGSRFAVRVCVIAPIQFLCAASASGDVILYDTLWIVEECWETEGNGDAWSGGGVFDGIHDLQVADDFVSSADGYLTEVTADYDAFFMDAPRGGAYVALFEDKNGRPAEDPCAEAVSTDILDDAHDWDCVFGLRWHRITARIPPGAVPIKEGVYWVVLQPLDLTDYGDWYYVLRSGLSQTGGIAHGRDGGRARPGYGNSTWVDMDNIGYGAGDVSMQVVATFGVFFHPDAAQTEYGRLLHGRVRRLVRDDNRFWVQQSAPIEPVDGNKSMVLVDTHIGDFAPSTATITVIQKQDSQQQASYRLEALRNDGTWIVLAASVPAQNVETKLERTISSNVEDFVDRTLGRRMRLRLVCSTSQEGPTFRHFVEEVQWELEP